MHASIYILLEAQQGRRGGIRKQQSPAELQNSRSSLLPERHKHEPQRPASPQFSPQDQDNEGYLSFDTQMRSPSSPSIPPLHPSILTFSFKHLSHILPEGHPLLGLLRVVQLHPGAGLSGQGDQELLQHNDVHLIRLLHFPRGNGQNLRGEASQLCGPPLITVPCPQALACSCSARTWGLLEADVTWTALKH